MATAIYKPHLEQLRRNGEVGSIVGRETPVDRMPGAVRRGDQIPQSPGVKGTASRFQGLPEKRVNPTEDALGTLLCTTANTAVSS